LIGGVAGGVAEFNTEAYDHIEENRFHRVDADPLSTFSVDVDTASYASATGAVRIKDPFPAVLPVR